MPTVPIEKCDLEIIAQNLEAIRKVQPDGSASFQGPFDSLVSVLGSIVPLTEKIPAIDRQKLLNSAVFTAGAKGPLSASSLKSELKKQEAIYLKSPFRSFALATTLTIRSNVKSVKGIQLNGCRLSFSRRHPKKFSLEPFKGLFALYHRDSAPPDYLRAIVHVKGRTEHEAVANALDSMDLLRGIWNYQVNRRTIWRNSFGGDPKPVNQILSGPIHTLHLPNGRPFSTNMFWFDRTFPQNIAEVDLRPSNKMSVAFELRY